MSMYHKFLINETDRFDAANFPQLETCLQKIVVQLNRQPQGPKEEMLLSFVKYHSINSQQVADYPTLATMISTKELPLGVLEELFDSSKSNPSFKKDLETHIRSYFSAAHLY